MSSRPGPTSATITRFAARFACIGAACEDTCCAFDWHVRLDRPDYSRLKAALAGSPAERERLERGCERLPDGERPGHHFAVLRRTPAGRCVFLEPDGLCAVHRDHGAAALPRVCASYPRVPTRIGDRLAVTTALSCPEAARLCLLAGDAVEEVPAEPGPLAHLLVRHHLPETGDDPFVRGFLEIRAAFVSLLGRRDLPVPSRLHAALHLAHALDAVRAGPRATADARTRAAVAAGVSEATLGRLHRECGAGSPSREGPAVLVEEMLVALLREQGATRLAALIHLALDHFRGIAEPRRARPPRAADAGLVAAYERGRRAWEGAFPERIARYATNGAVNFWLRDPFTAAPDLASHALDLCARLAAIRFLLFTHPAIREVGAPAVGDPAHAAVLDRAAVEVVYTFSRAVEHGDGTRERLRALAVEHARGRRQELDLVRF